MRFEATPIAGAYVVHPHKFVDERGFFARTFGDDAFAQQGIRFETRQCNVSFNHARGTLRGIHYQVPPMAEAKLVRCTAGSVYDVILDLRPDSATYCQWFALELSAEAHNAVLIPEGCAHGFLSLTENTEVFYQIAGQYAPDYARGVRWNDPAFGIAWPFKPAVILDRDADWPDYSR